MNKTTKMNCALVILILVCFLLMYFFLPRYQLNEEYTFKLPESDYTLEVYCDSWFQLIPSMPGNASDVPCIVKLINHTTGKSLYKKKFEMLQLLDPIIINSNKLEIGKFTTWEF